MSLKEAVKFADLLEGVMSRVCALSMEEHPIIGASSGFRELDNMIGGLEKIWRKVCKQWWSAAVG